MTGQYRTVIYTTDGDAVIGDPTRRSVVSYSDYIDALSEAVGNEVGWVRLSVDGHAAIYPTRHIHHVAVRKVLDE